MLLYQDCVVVLQNLHYRLSLFSIDRIKAKYIFPRRAPCRQIHHNSPAWIKSKPLGKPLPKAKPQTLIVLVMNKEIISGRSDRNNPIKAIGCWIPSNLNLSHIVGRHNKPLFFSSGQARIGPFKKRQHPSPPGTRRIPNRILATIRFYRNSMPEIYAYGTAIYRKRC